MYDPNANWSAAAASRQQSAIYKVAIDGLATQYSTAPVKSPAGTVKPYLQMPGVIGQRVDPLTSKHSVQISTIEIVDRDDELTSLVATETASPTVTTLVNRKVTIYSGDSSIDEADYAPIAIGEIGDHEFAGLNTLKLTLRDVKRAQEEEVCRNADADPVGRIDTRLSAAASAGSDQIQVVSLANIEAPSPTEASDTGVKLYLSNTASDHEEKVQVLAILNASTGLIRLRKPLVNSYIVGDRVRWASTIVAGNVINVIRAFLTGQFGTPGSAGTASFPLDEALGEPTGLDISSSDIDDAYLIRERDQGPFTEHKVFIELRSPEKGATLMEKKLYATRGYPVLLGSGKLAFRSFRPEFAEIAAAGLPTITQDDVISYRWKRPHRLHINRIEVGVDYDLDRNEASQTIPTEDTDDQDDTKEIAVLDVENLGLRAIDSGVRLAEGCGARMLRRYLAPPLELEVECHMTKRAIEMGDVVQFTHPIVSNIETGTRGYTARRVEVIERAEHANQKRIQFVLDFYDYGRPFITGPATPDPDYDSATAAQQEYAYVGGTGTPPAAFPDGRPAYEVI
jgi:hypothetical protein